MNLRVYNTLTRQKEDFKTVAPGKVTMYVCGPTRLHRPGRGDWLPGGGADGLAIDSL